MLSYVINCKFFEKSENNENCGSGGAVTERVAAKTEGSKYLMIASCGQVLVLLRFFSIPHELTMWLVLAYLVSGWIIEVQSSYIRWPVSQLVRGEGSIQIPCSKVCPF